MRGRGESFYLLDKRENAMTVFGGKMGRNFEAEGTRSVAFVAAGEGSAVIAEESCLLATERSKGKDLKPRAPEGGGVW